jgi:hypothetical protein
MNTVMSLTQIIVFTDMLAHTDYIVVYCYCGCLLLTEALFVHGMYTDFTGNESQRKAT